MFSFVALLFPPSQEKVWNEAQCLSQKHESTLDCWMLERELLA